MATATDDLASEKSPESLGEVLDFMRILWSIDYPFQTTEPAVAFMETAPISQADRERIYRLNARRVFHIGDERGEGGA